MFSEQAFEVIKIVLGFGQFSLRVIKAVRGELRLVRAAWNLRRMRRPINSDGTACLPLRAL